MWHFEQLPINADRGFQVRVTRAGCAVDVETFASGLRDEASARDSFIEQIANCPYDGVFWETPPVTRSTLSSPFEYVLLDAPTLARMSPDTHSFKGHFSDTQAVVDFANLGGDAHLIAPCPRGEASHYVHLAAFARQAPRARVHELLSCVGQCLLTRVGDEPLWLSSSGLGVGWLHLRLDSRPKYYNHRPYRVWPRPDPGGGVGG